MRQQTGTTPHFIHDEISRVAAVESVHTTVTDTDQCAGELRQP